MHLGFAHREKIVTRTFYKLWVIYKSGYLCPYLFPFLSNAFRIDACIQPSLIPQVVFTAEVVIR